MFDRSRAFNDENLLAITIFFTDQEDTHCCHNKNKNNKTSNYCSTNAHTILSEQLREERRNERELSCQVILIETLYITTSCAYVALGWTRMLSSYWDNFAALAFNVFFSSDDYDDGFETSKRVRIIREIASQR